MKSQTPRRIALVVGCLVLPLLLSSPIAAAAPESTPVERLERRLRRLEPPEPVTMQALPEEEELARHAPAKIVPIRDVIKKGKRIPFRTIRQDADYVRPVYEEHWHSTYWGGRWSYVPTRIHYALHRLFPTYDIGISGELTFKGNVGVPFPMFQNETDLDLYLVVFQTSVFRLYTAGNQIVVVGAPRRTGVEVVVLKTSDLRPAERDRLLSIQLATPAGDELDYAYIAYMEPDFWKKQKETAKNRKP